MVGAEEIRAIASVLPRTEERYVRDRVTFRVGRIVYATISADETMIGFAYPREERAGLIEAEPEKFAMPRRSDERYHWVRARLAALDPVELRELIEEAWRMVVPNRVAAAYFDRWVADE